MSIEKVKNSLSQKYEFIKLIGKGGFAEVYLAKDKLLEREVAIKILLSQHAGDTEIIERFIREAKLYAKFDHKNLIPIFETGKVEDNAFLVMKYVNGFSLKDFIERDGALEAGLIIEVVKGMASALNYIHGKGIIHRDIKPANILIEKDTNRVFLADFGIARPISSKTLTQTGMLIGTPYYISPEQIKKGTADKRSDIYALGTTLYEIIAGTPVFKCETPIEVLYKHVNEDPKPIASISPNITMEMKHIVEKCLEKDPNDRFQNANEILDLIASGITKEIKYNYKEKGSGFFKSRSFKLLLILLLFTSSVFILYQYTGMLDFLKQKDIKNSSEIIKDESKKENKKEDKKEIREIANKESIEKKEEEKIGDPKKENIAKIDEKKNIITKKNIVDKKKSEVPELSNSEKKYKEFFDLAKDSYNKSKFTSADIYLKEAKKFKETLELYQLDEKIQNKLKKPVKIKDKKTVKIDKKPLKKISLFKLKPELLQSYISNLNTIRVIIPKNRNGFIKRGIVSGQITVKVKINEFGKLSFQDISHNNLVIKPLLSRKRTLQGIFYSIQNISFSPPIDKSGNKAILQNWRVTFIVSKYKNRIILKRKV